MKRTILAVLIALVACVAIGVWRMSQPPPELRNLKGASEISPTDPFEKKMQRLAEQEMLDAWNRFGIRLRCDANSLRDCDEYLDRISKDPKFQACSDKDKRAEGIIAGAFVGEAIRRTHGGIWMETTDVKDAGYGLQVYGDTIYPVTWCLKRLFNGKEDSLAEKYSYFILQKTNGSYDVTLYTNTSSGPHPLTNIVK